MKKLLLSILAIFLIVEEWLWDVLTALGHKLVVWLHLARVERWLATLSPWGAMASFLLPTTILLPVQLAALLLSAHGRVVEGLGLLIAAKILATLLIARIFNLTRPQLLTFVWFAKLYATISRWLAWAHERLRATAVYQQMTRLKCALRERWAAWSHADRP